jgi:hypothetical protein
MTNQNVEVKLYKLRKHAHKAMLSALTITESIHIGYSNNYKIYPWGLL